MLPTFLSTILPSHSSRRSRLPRPLVAIGILALMAAAVRYNTIVHPFTLADNRHYVFYVFRILRRHPALKYAVIPIYLLSAWGAVQTLAAAEPDMLEERRHGDGDGGRRQEGNRVSFLLIYGLSTTLSLITAPLVEPRYFILPWLIWRIHVPPHAFDRADERGSSPKAKRREGGMEWVHEALWWLYRYRLWLETFWFLVVNGMTCYVFLHWGFEWQSPEERGNVQRFMW